MRSQTTSNISFRAYWRSAQVLTLLAMFWMVSAIALPIVLSDQASAQSSVRPPANATTNSVPRAGTPTPIPGRQQIPDQALKNGEVPGGSLGNRSEADIWRIMREGTTGNVSIPDKQSGQLIRGTNQRLSTEQQVRDAMTQQGGGYSGSFLGNTSVMSWVKFREGPLATYGAYAMGATIILLVLFFLMRGRIRVDHGLSGQMIQRFGSIERLGHWILAVSFIILALTGLNLLYGRHFLIPVLGPETYAGLAYIGKLTHNYVAFAFMLGLVMIFINWVRHNLPHPRDLAWLAKGGGVFVKGVHPSAKKFNAGQKIVFWLVILGGVSISLSGLALMFPFESAMFAKTFVFLNNFGFNLPTALTPIQEMQYQSLWHAIMALFLICVILAHIYIGSIGMEGAIDSMTTGDVDMNWAKEHHDLWVEEELGKSTEAPSGAGVQPAE
ncbi:MAG: formate dehydrogenase subunit gamma [Pseudomonadota bacterium]